ncbi:permease [Sphingomonas koreensis]|jgi:cell division transport system permease protein|uniref:Permease n=1 Tax=Sphingomonas koreensis TaxID=93064 RepID=A0A1L6J7C6_9SPHN|nr:FtsX-like permease family protein [Sphingomonas koreensis]APR51737.1 permease [Sphingomonas koreensis]MDC7811909.1 FtsX-like permease family protein [Sphingomonas koreensis]RSU21353.1 permease [Sphingomonas koreensis]RSU23655.1 permease [Sphingomonas koreensis]RSU32082.1 permease [Sphingomonas koreensis]
MNPFVRSKPEDRLLDESRRTRGMLWVMAIMLFLTVLAAALGLGMAGASRTLDRQLAGRLTIQLVEGDAARRDAAAKAIVQRVRTLPGVTRVAEVDRNRLAELLEPWLGEAGLDADLPMPAMIDVDLASGDAAGIERVRAAARAVAPAAQIDRHAQWLSPVSAFLNTITWFAVALVVLMATATTIVVLLTARGGLDTHRDTIAVLHMLGSTDMQVARLFQRRIALDTLLGGLLGTTAALAMVWLLGQQAAGLGSELLGGVSLVPLDWLLLLALPLVFALMALLAARVAVLGTLGKTL